MPNIIGFTVYLSILLLINVIENVNSVLQNQRNLVLSKSSTPCVHGRLVNGHCVCLPGWTGTYCEHCFGRQKLNNLQHSFTDGDKNYTTSSRCTWIIDSENSVTSPLLLTMDQFATECCWDHVYIYDGDSVDDNLLAVLSGEHKGRQISVTSGKSLIYFVSDLAYNLEGFNIGYEWGACPKNCTNHGNCIKGICSCNTGFTGEACDIPICENDGITEPCAHGICENGKCKCTEKVFNGDYCQGFTEGVWDYVHTEGSFEPRASHAIAIDNEDNAWIFGGFYFNKKIKGKNRDLVKYDFKTKKFLTINPVNTPPKNRYDHSLVYYNGHLYLFGGVIDGKVITNELWSFEIHTKKWTLLYIHNNTSEAFPEAVAGHTAHMINGEMYIFFGYNPYHEYIHRPQIYNIANNKWEIGPDHDTIIGRFGQSSSLYYKDKNPIILIYGGYNELPSNAAFTPNEELLIYDVLNKSWKILDSGLEKLFRHTSIIIDDQLLIIGGNKHNESPNVKSKDCFSNDVLAYDILCETWTRLKVNSGDLKINRYGHVSASYNRNGYIFGGFDGFMKNDVLKLSLPQCNILANSAEECAESAVGTRCIFLDKKCIKAEKDVSYKQSFISIVKNDNPRNIFDNCPGMQIKSNQCSEYKDCQSCFQQKDCGWCESVLSCVNSDTECADGSAVNIDSKICSIKSRALMPLHEVNRSCSLASNCFSCQQLPHCSWYIIENKHLCIPKKDELLLIEQHNKIQSERLAQLTHSVQTTTSLADFRYLRPFEQNVSSCRPPCSNFTDCSGCIQINCMWCPLIKRCVNMDAYMISFPYGQCQSWITQANSNNNHACQLNPNDCSLQKTCEECQNIGPQCGWCDNGEGTGVGKCLSGSSAGPSNKDACKPPKSWFYTGQPSCQCNGHSHCNKTTHILLEEKCNKCADHTEGERCERCSDGFFGDPRNGGNCTECQCNDQAYSCDNESGDCYCTTKGVTGAHCDKCETRYEGDPKNNKLCSYKLSIDFIFTFKLDNNEDKDRYVNQINFFAVPIKDDTDVQFSITCDGEYPALVDLNMTRTEPTGETVSKKWMINQECTSNGFKRTYQANNHEFPFGANKNTTFHVTVHNFTTPIKIQISFAQSPPINWVLFFVIFAACFVVLLVVAGLVWIIKQRVERYQQMQNNQIQISRMAARPFGEAYLDLSPNRYDSATPISVEPCSNLQTGIYTLIVRLPTGGKKFTPHGTSGLAVASTLCNLTQSQLAILSPSDNESQEPNQKSKFRRFIKFKNPFSRGD